MALDYDFIKSIGLRFTAGTLAPTTPAQLRETMHAHGIERYMNEFQIDALCQLLLYVYEIGHGNGQMGR